MHNILVITQWVVVIAAVLSFIVGGAILMSWAGKCKKCGSWKNWEDMRYSHDDHQPHLYFEDWYTQCSACGNKTHTRTITKAKPLSSC